MHRLLLIISLLLTTAMGAGAQQTILEGDLLFATSTVAGKAITLATVHDSVAPPVYHVAIATWVGDSLYALEANDERGVVLAPYSAFARQALKKGSIMVGRLRDRGGAEQSVSNAMEHLGKPYDDLFLIDTQEIYCSELVQLSYVDSRGNRIFPLIHMSFHDARGHILDYWRSHYARRGMLVPEGALGTNPAMIATSPALEIINVIE